MFPLSFIRHSTRGDDTYAKHVEFRRLHNIFFTNDKSTKMGITHYSICNKENVHRRNRQQRTPVDKM